MLHLMKGVFRVGGGLGGHSHFVVSKLLRGLVHELLLHVELLLKLLQLLPHISLPLFQVLAALLRRSKLCLLDAQLLLNKAVELLLLPLLKHKLVQTRGIGHTVPILVGDELWRSSHAVYPVHLLLSVLKLPLHIQRDERSWHPMNPLPQLHQRQPVYRLVVHRKDLVSHQQKPAEVRRGARHHRRHAVSSVLSVTCEEQPHTHLVRPCLVQTAPAADISLHVGYQRVRCVLLGRHELCPGVI
mmetsp:Transcript_4558/g.8946  ORF Transcript_4558/g.8946 Transcript_4558/m.8946 type:complete len:243 (+) Transcript_4558:306-1034(+)